MVENITCKPCHEALRVRMKDVVVHWASEKVGRSISRTTFLLLRIETHRGGKRGYEHASMIPCAVEFPILRAFRTIEHCSTRAVGHRYRLLSDRATGPSVSC